MDIAPRYAAILMGFSNGIGTLAGLTCPFVTEKLIARGARGWEKVFLLASLIHFTGITFYAVYASGELQDWAEPKDEQEPWLLKNFSKGTIALFFFPLFLSFHSSNVFFHQIFLFLLYN